MASRFVLISVILGVLAGTAIAAPTLTVTKGGSFATNHLDANGDWVFNIQISNTNPVPTGSARLAAELGFTASGSALRGASNLSTGANDDFDTSNPGTVIFGWEDLVDVDPGAGVNMKPVGLQSNCVVGCSESTPGTSPNTVFTALGSIDFNTVGPHDYIQIKTKGPTSTSLISTLTVSGKYGAGDVFGRITELGGGNAVNYDTYNNAFAFVALDGDVNLDGARNGLDIGPFLLGFQAGTGKWFDGDVTGDGLVNGLDTGSVLGITFGQTVPEPATGWLALSMLAALNLYRKSRSIDAR